MEEVEELATLLPVVAAGNAGAPRSHVGSGVVQVVRSDGASCVRKCVWGEKVNEGEVG